MAKIFRMNVMKLVVIMLDCMFIIFSYVLTLKLAALERGIPYNNNQDIMINNVPWIFAILITTYWLFDSYNFAGRRQFSKAMYNLLICHVIIAVELIIVDHYYQLTQLSLLMVLSALGLQCIFVFGMRSFLHWIQFRGFRNKKIMIIAGNDETAKDLVERITSSGKVWFEVKSIILTSQWNVNIMESLQNHSTDIDLVLLGYDITPQIKSEVIRYVGSRRIEVLVVPELYELYLMRAEEQFIDDLLVYSVLPPNLSGFDKALKRSIDIILSIVLLLLTSPIMLLMLSLIPLTSKGKAIYKQERIGLNGKPFMVLKFRTMVDNAEAMTGPVLATDQDKRITRLGSFIRSTRIDELPQLINVLKGEMSVVGPRPEREHFIKEFTKNIPHFTYRLMVKPGLTGLAQVRGKYSTSSADKLRYDLAYIKSYSVFLDIKILLQTIIVVLQREQSKGVKVTEPAMQTTAIHEIATTTTQSGAIPSYPILAANNLGDSTVIQFVSQNK